MRREVGVLDIGDEHAERAQAAGHSGIDGLAQTKLLGDLRRVGAAGAAADDQCVAAGVRAAHDGHGAHRPDHRRVD